MAALPFSATSRQSKSGLNPKFCSGFIDFTQRTNNSEVFLIRTSGSGRGRRKLCVKNVISDTKKDVREPVTKEGYIFLIISITSHKDK